MKRQGEPAIGDSGIVSPSDSLTFRYRPVLYLVPYMALFLFLGCYSFLPFLLAGEGGLATFVDFPTLAKVVLLAGPAFALFGILGNFKRWHPISVSENGIATLFRHHTLRFLAWSEVKCIEEGSERDYLLSRNRMVYRVKGRRGSGIQFEEGITDFDVLLGKVGAHAKLNNIKIISAKGRLSSPREL